MRNKIILALTASALIVGCGSSHKSNDTNTTTDTTTPNEVTPENPISNITVIDSYVIDATVCDIDNLCVKTDKNGIATARFNTDGTITSKGGYIDANLNNKIDADELKAPNMKASGDSSIITPMTDLIINGADENQLASVLGIDVSDLYTDPITNDNIILAKALQMTSLITADADSKDKLIEKINSYVEGETSSSDLPNFDSVATLSGISLFANYATTSTSSNDSKSFITTIQNSTSSSVETFLKNAEEIKINLATPTTSIPTSDSTSTPTSTPVTTTPVTTTPATSTTTPSTTTTTTTTTTTVSSTGSALPSIGSGSSAQTTVVVSSDSSAQTGSALPDLNSEQNTGLVDSTTTDYTLTPSGTATTPKYYAIFSNDETVELTETDANNYKYKSTQKYNLNENDFNITSYLDLNMTSVFDVSTYTLADGHYNGKFLINFKDTYTKADVNITAYDVDYFINDSNLSKITLKNTKDIKLDTSSGIHRTNTLTADKPFDKYYIDIASDVGATITSDLKDLNSTFILADHNYSVSFMYDINGSSKTLSGDFKVIRATTPSFALLSSSFDDILVQKTSLNLNIANTSSNPLKCEITGITGLNCIVDSNNDLNITGTPTSAIGTYRPTIKLTDETYNLTYEKTIDISIIDKIDTRITSNWNLSSANDGNYSNYKISMDLVGGLTNNVVTLDTTLTTLQSGSPENNSTVLVLNNDNNYTNYIEFTFDNTVYSSDDVFKITTGDGRSTEFKLGDITNANNSVYLK